MKKVFSHAKPYKWTILLTILLLFIQAMADLRLPNYMSKIVDVGIQQKGLENPSPPVLSTEATQFLEVILPKNVFDSFLDSYENTETLVLKETANREALDLIMGRAVWTFLELVPGDQFDFENTSLEALILIANSFHKEDIIKAYQSTETIEENLLKQSAFMLGNIFYQDNGINLDSNQKSYIIKMGSKMMFATLIATLASLIVVFFSTRVGSSFSRDLRSSVFNAIQTYSHNEFEKFTASSLIIRTTQDIRQIQMLFSGGLRFVVSAPLMAVGGLIMIQRHNQGLSWIILIIILILMGLFVVVFMMITPKFKIQQERLDALNQVARENINGVMVIRAFDNLDFEAERFENANANHADTILYIARMMVLMMPLLMFLMNTTSLAILWFGSKKIALGVMQIGDMMAFMQYAIQIIASFLMIAMIFVFIPRAMVSINRIKEVLETQGSVQDPKVPLLFNPQKQGEIEFKNVCFRYEDAKECVVERINFKVSKGETVAFIGSTGSGKSTLLKLLLRFFDVTRGEILVNGRNIKEVTQEDLRDTIAYIPQEASLLSGDVASNVRFGRPDASDEDVKKALKIAQAGFVLENKQGIHMPISQEATNVSGGQKQRISIARALCKEAPIIVFDDSFSALDFKTDLSLRTSLKKELKDATFLIVAQRINTIQDADQIIVLDKGMIVGHGKHDELLKTCQAYREIAESQLSQKELS